MIKAGQEIRILRKKTKSWLASLTYYSASGNVNVDTFSQRLQSIFKSVFKSDVLQRAVKGTIPETIEAKRATVIKKRLMSRLSPDKMYKRMLSYPRIHTTKTLGKDGSSPFTLGRLLIAWAVLTDQPPQKFILKVYQKVNRLYLKWRDSSGCLGLSDEECYSHPKESARFLSGICRILIQATPEENLVLFIQSGIKTLGAMIGLSSLEKEIYKLLGQASRFVTKDAAQKIELALKANPCARERINIPELKALVLREEARFGWGSNTEKEALNTLRGSLSPELKESADNNSEVIRSSMEIVGRRGLLNNLLDALNGQLRPRFVESVKRFLKSIVHVESKWEFDASNSTQENTSNIRSWLFRR